MAKFSEKFEEASSGKVQLGKSYTLVTILEGKTRDGKFPFGKMLIRLP